MRNSSAKIIALGGVLAALAVVLMCLGGALLIATYVCPMLCMLLLQAVLKICGRRIAWAWYGAVAILSLLLCSDKEAAAVFLFLGYYPIVKPWLDKLPFKWLWKLLLFNGATLTMYWLLIHLMGMEALAAEFQELGAVACVVMLLLGNLIFFLLDRILERKIKLRRGGK